MRISVDLNDAQIRTLDKLAKRRGKSRAALILDAIGDFLAKHRIDQVRDSFGLWSESKVDGLEYQERARGEW